LCTFYYKLLKRRLGGFQYRGHERFERFANTAAHPFWIWTMIWTYTVTLVQIIGLCWGVNQCALGIGVGCRDSAWDMAKDAQAFVIARNV
jgi:hypothetical protein